MYRIPYSIENKKRDCLELNIQDDLVVSYEYWLSVFGSRPSHKIILIQFLVQALLMKS